MPNYYFFLDCLISIVEMTYLQDCPQIKTKYRRCYTHLIQIIYFAVPQVHNTIAKCGITFKSKLNETMLNEIQLL